MPEYAAIGRYNLISSSSSSNSRLLINNILIDDQGYYKCKSSSIGQHNIKLIVNCMFYIFKNKDFLSFFCYKLANPHLSPSSPILLYPVNRTFSITCSLLCDTSIEINNLIWLVNEQPLYEDRHQFLIETISSNTQRLTVFLNKKNNHFHPSNYTCRYNGKESSILVRRRTSKLFFYDLRTFIYLFIYLFILEEELHRLPRQEGSSSAYLLQAAFDTGQTQYQSSYKYLLIFFLLLKIINHAI